MNIFSRLDGPNIAENGEKMAKKRNPVYLLKQFGPFQVETREGVMSGNAGDYLAYDPISGDVWPIVASYVQQHYEPF